MDADVGCNVLGLIYMKGHVAHSGFPEISYGPMADRLVRAGLKVARVEQTETPEMLAQRKKTFKRGKDVPKVVNREVCSVMTLGTRTFCYLDDASGLLEDTHGGGGSLGPLLAIREVLCDQDANVLSSGEDACAKPVCEFGITLVDALRATVTIGQFADDVLRSRMNTLLTVFSPSEVC
jgi:DNA mismatch repair protein MSH6